MATRLLGKKQCRYEDIEIKSETRHWDEARKVTKQSRAKEEEEDYRYFPEPDIPTIVLGNEFLVSLKAKMPELPDEKKFGSSGNMSFLTM